MMDLGSYYMSSPTQMKQEKMTVNNAKWLPTEQSGAVKFDVKPVVSIMDLGRSLLEAAREGDTERVHEYMAKGAPFTTDWLGTSPLHLAAKNNHLETCKVLLRGGLNKECKTKVERTPLHFAVSECNVDIVELLLAHKANPDTKDMLKMTPLHWAVEKECEEIVDLLLQSGANPHLKSKFGKTPIYMAAEKNNRTILAKLVEPTRTESIKQTQMATSSLVEEMNVDTPPEPNNSDDDIIEEDDSASSLGDAFMHFADPGGTTTAAGIELLKEHGIHLMKDDDSNSVIQSALESGRRLILSEAGKFVLKNSLDTDVFPTTSKPNPYALSRPKILRAKPLVPVQQKKKIIQMTADEYRQLFKRGNTTTTTTGKFAMPSPPKAARRSAEREVLQKLPQETTITMQQQEAPTPVTPITISDVDKQVQELRKECTDLRKQLEISQRQNQEYQRRLEKLEAIVLKRPS